MIGLDTRPSADVELSITTSDESVFSSPLRSTFTQRNGTKATRKPLRSNGARLE